jgi:hypothetical protein
MRWSMSTTPARRLRCCCCCYRSVVAGASRTSPATIAAPYSYATGVGRTGYSTNASVAAAALAPSPLEATLYPAPPPRREHLTKKDGIYACTVENTIIRRFTTTFGFLTLGNLTL